MLRPPPLFFNLDPPPTDKVPEAMEVSLDLGESGPFAATSSTPPITAVAPSPRNMNHPQVLQSPRLLKGGLGTVSFASRTPPTRRLSSVRRTPQQGSLGVIDYSHTPSKTPATLAQPLKSWFKKGIDDDDSEKVRSEKTITFFAHLVLCVRMMSYFATWHTAPVQLTYVSVLLLVFFVAHTTYYKLKTHHWLRQSMIPAVVLFPIVQSIESERPLFETPGGVLSQLCIVPLLWTYMGGRSRNRDIFMCVILAEYCGLMLYDFSMFTVTAKSVFENCVQLLLWGSFLACMRYTHRRQKKRDIQAEVIFQTISAIKDNVWTVSCDELEGVLGNEISQLVPLQGLAEVVRLLEEMRKHHPSLRDADMKQELLKIPSGRDMLPSAPSSPLLHRPHSTVLHKSVSFRPMVPTLESSMGVSGSTGHTGTPPLSQQEWTFATVPQSPRVKSDQQQQKKSEGESGDLSTEDVTADFGTQQSVTFESGTNNNNHSFDVRKRVGSLSLVNDSTQVTILLVEIPMDVADNGMTGDEMAAVMGGIINHAKLYGGMPIWSCGLELYLGFTDSKLGTNHRIAASAVAWGIFGEYSASENIYPYLSLASGFSMFTLVSGEGRTVFMGNCPAVMRCRELTEKAKRVGLRFPLVDLSVAIPIQEYFRVDDDQIISATSPTVNSDILNVIRPYLQNAVQISQAVPVSSFYQRNRSGSRFQQTVTMLRKMSNGSRASLRSEESGSGMKAAHSIEDLIMDPTSSNSFVLRNGSLYPSSAGSNSTSRLDLLPSMDTTLTTSELVPEIIQQLRNVWDRHDKHHVGFIKADECWWVLHDMGLKLSTDRFFAFLQCVDPQGTENISYETIQSALLGEILAGTIAIRYVQHTLRDQGMSSHQALAKGTAVWKAVCQGSLFNTIDAVELRKLLKRMKVKLSMEEALLIIKELGENGQLNFDQFVTLMSVDELNQADELTATIKNVHDIFANTTVEKKYSNSEQMAASKAKLLRSNFDSVFLPLFTVYNLFVVLEVPLTASLEPFLFDKFSSAFELHKIVTNLWDIVFYTSFFTKFFLGREENGRFIHKKKEIRWLYVKSLEFWKDLLICLPLDAIMYWGFPSAYYPAGLVYRMNKMILLASFDESYIQLTIDWSPVVTRLGRTVLWFCIIVHLFACAFVGISRFTHDPQSSETDRYGNIDPDYNTFLFSGVPQYFEKAPFLKYLIAVDWAQKTMYGLGAGNPIAPLDIQVSFSLVTVIVGVCMLTVFISSLSNAINETGSIAAYNERIDLVRTFFKYIDSKEDCSSLEKEIEAYYTHIFNTMRALRLEDDPLDDLNKDLWVQVQVELARNLFSRVPIFAELLDDPAFVFCLMQRCKPRVLLPFEIVFTKGEPGTSMFFVSVGLCVSWDTAGGPLEYISGDYFGEIQLLHPVPRQCTIECYDVHTTVYELEKSDFNDVMTLFPQFVKVVQDAVRTSVRDIVIGGGSIPMDDEEDALIQMWLNTQEKGVLSDTTSAASVASRHLTIAQSILK